MRQHASVRDVTARLTSSASVGQGSISAESQAPREILFVDPDVLDSNLLLTRLDRPVTVIHLARDGDPLVQIAMGLAGETGVTALHILSHGAPGVLSFAAGAVDQAALVSSSSRLASLRAAFAPEAGVVLYGCAVSEDSATFAATLSGLLDLPVHAATRAVGAGADFEPSAFGVCRSAFEADAVSSYPHRLATFNFTGATDNQANITQTVSGVTLTLTDSREDGAFDWNILSAGGAGGTTGDAAAMQGAQVTYTFTFDTAVDVTNLVIVEGTTGFQANAGTFTFTPNTGTAVTGVTIPQAGNFDGTTATLNFSGITSFTVVYTGGAAPLVFDTVNFNIAVVTAAASNAAGFNTTNGTNLTPSLTFVGNAETLTIGTAGHVVGSTISGAGGADTLSAVTGIDFTQATAVADFETLVIADNGSVTMTGAQHAGFSTAISGGGSETITISGASTLTGAAAIEKYVLGSTASSFTLGTDAQTVTGGAGNDTISVGTRTTSGTLDGAGGTDLLSMGNGADISGSTVSNFETAEITSGGSVTMTGAQHDGFTSGFTAAGAETITLDATGGDTAITGSAAIENYVLTAAGFTFTTGTTTQNVAGSSGIDTISVSGTHTGTIDGGGNTDILVLADGTSTSGATITNMESLTLASGGSFTMAAGQLSQFAGTITAAGTETLNVSGDGDWFCRKLF
jgi:hypothetical protein